MLQPISQLIVNHVRDAAQLYHRLVIVAGPPGSGKTGSLRELHAKRGWPLINLNLSLSARLIELTTKQRALRVAKLVDDIVHTEAAEVVILDNMEMLFHPDLKQDPLRLLQNLARNRTIVAAWRGAQAGRGLIYAVPEHPEYRRFNDPQALIVCTGKGHDVRTGTLLTKEFPA